MGAGKTKPAYAQVGESLPAGAIVLIASGLCPVGYVEETSLNGRLPMGTLAANANVGTTGGADQVTPAGTNAGSSVSAHAGAAVADHASHTHTYSQVVNHTHPLATGTGATGNFAQVIGTIDTSSGGTGAAPTQTALGTVSGNAAGGVAQGTTAGPGAVLTHAVTQPANHVVTQPTFTGTPLDNRSAFVRVIYCRKT